MEKDRADQLTVNRKPRIRDHLLSSVPRSKSGDVLSWATPRGPDSLNIGALTNKINRANAHSYSGVRTSFQACLGGLV